MASEEVAKGWVKATSRALGGDADGPDGNVELPVDDPAQGGVNRLSLDQLKGQLQMPSHLGPDLNGTAGRRLGVVDEGGRTGEANAELGWERSRRR